MSLRSYLSWIGISSIFAWMAWVAVLLNVNPKESGLFGLVLFYVTFGLAIIGTVTMALSVFRVHVLKRNVLEREIRIAFRHAFLFGLMVLISFVLSAAEKFSVWISILLVAMTAFVEFLFLQFHRGRG